MKHIFLVEDDRALSQGVCLALAAGALEGMFWFFSYRFTVAPILVLLPVFAVLGALVPLVLYRAVSRMTVVERLREAE